MSTVAFVVAGVGAAVLVCGLLTPNVEAPKARAGSTSAKWSPRWIAGPFGVAGTF